ncbi:MAG: DUF423 domain-containing protein [Bacteroidota bacterium]
MMRKQFLRLAALSGFTAVILGAFGAHALENYISTDSIDSFNTGVRYQFIHTIMLAIIGVLGHFGRKSYLWYAGWLFFVGIILFSGSIYLLSVKEIIDFGAWLGIVTPIGGTLFLAGWVCFFWATYSSFDRSQRPE